MKNCEIVKDLLPLYAEDMASEESSAFVKEHLEGCESCRAALDELKKPVRQPDPAAPLKTVRRAVKKRGWLIAGLIACLVASLFVGAIARFLLKPVAIHSAKEVFDVTMAAVPERDRNVAPLEYVFYMPLEDEEYDELLDSYSLERSSVFAVTPECFSLTIEPDGTILRDKGLNSDFFSLMREVYSMDLFKSNKVSQDAVKSLAEEKNWVILGGDNASHMGLAIPDRLTVEMSASEGAMLQIAYGNKTYTNSWISSDRTHYLSANGNTDTDHIMTVCAYTTRLQQMIKWLGLKQDITETMTFSVSWDDLDAIVFEPLNNKDHTVLYQREGYTVEAGFALPRLVMNYYFMIALIGTAILFIVWLMLLLTKKKAARRVFDILLILAGSFTLAFLAAGFPATTIAPVRELGFVLVIALLLIGAGLCGRGLLRKE